MASGVDHYRDAERLAERAYHFTYGDGSDPVTGAALAAVAQVHATLALAAATALAGAVAAEVLGEQPDLIAWIKAAGVEVDG